jgi:hypothetical protein
VTQRVSDLGNHLVTACQAKDAAEKKISSLMFKVATTNQRWEATEEQCKRLVVTEPPQK